MTEQEVINNQLKTRIEIQDEKFNMFMNEMRGIGLMELFRRGADEYIANHPVEGKE